MTLAVVSGSSWQVSGSAISTKTLALNSQGVANTIVVLQIVTLNGAVSSPSYTPVTSVTDTNGLTWARRSQKQVSPQYGATTQFNSYNIETWWAFASAAQSNTVTVTLAGSTLLFADLFTVSGSLRTSNPWDTNASLPGIHSVNDPAANLAAPVSPTISTTSAKSLVFGIEVDHGQSGNATNAVSPFTDILTARPALNIGADIFSNVYSAAQTNITPTFTGAQYDNVVVVDALSGDAPLGATGIITTQLTKVSQALAATEKFTGTIATHLTKASQAMAGSITPRITGTVTTVLHGISQQAHSPGTVTGAIVTQLTKANLALSATEVLTGAIVTHLDANAAFQLHATTYEAFVGHIVTNLSPMKFAQSLTGEERIVGHVTTKLGSASGQIVANIVEALVIIQGPIIMALPRIRSVLLAAKLGQPGAGKWFSWRYTDS